MTLLLAFPKHSESELRRKVMRCGHKPPEETALTGGTRALPRTCDGTPPPPPPPSSPSRCFLPDTILSGCTHLRRCNPVNFQTRTHAWRVAPRWPRGTSAIGTRTRVQLKHISCPHLQCLLEAGMASSVWLAWRQLFTDTGEDGSREHVHSPLCMNTGSASGAWVAWGQLFIDTGEEQEMEERGEYVNFRAEVQPSGTGILTGTFSSSGAAPNSRHRSLAVRQAADMGIPASFKGD